MLDNLNKLISSLLGVIGDLTQAQREQRRLIAEYLSDIEKCLWSSAQRLREGKLPNREWQELNVHAEQLPDMIGSVLKPEKVSELTELLKEASQTIPSSSEIDALEAAAGTFRGMGIVIGKRTTIARRGFISTILGTSVGVTAGWVAGKDKIQLPQFLRITDTEEASLPRWIMHTPFGEVIKDTILYNAPQMVCDLVDKMSDSRFQISLERKENSDSEEILRKVSVGEIQCGYSGIYYTSPKYRALFFGCAIPFGLNAQEQNAWIHYKKEPGSELTFMQEIYKRLLNVIAFPAGSTGAQMGGWFRKQVESVDDLNGLIMRIPGLGADVMEQLGVVTDRQLGRPLRIDEAIQKLNDRRFDAVEWTGPYDGIRLGIHKAAIYYYYPGWWEPSTTFDVQVNIDDWEKLNPNYQQILRQACHETHLQILAEYDQKNSYALENLPSDIELKKFSDEILTKAKIETNKLLEIYASNDPNEEKIFEEVYTEWRNFRDRIRQWYTLNEPINIISEN